MLSSVSGQFLIVLLSLSLSTNSLLFPLGKWCLLYIAIMLCQNGRARAGRQRRLYRIDRGPQVAVPSDHYRIYCFEVRCPWPC